LENLEEEEEKAREAPRKSRKAPKLPENLEEEEEEQPNPKPSLHPRSFPTFPTSTGQAGGAGIPKPLENIPKSLFSHRRSRGNFVRLNLRRKRYVRGPALRGNCLRRQVWKEKWRKKFPRFGGGGSDLCFRCGERGHWAAQCPAGKDLGWPPMEKDPKEEEEEEPPLPTLEEVARRTNSRLECDPSGSLEGESSQSTLEEPHSLDSWSWECNPSPAPAPVEPLYVLGEDGKIPDPPPEVLGALQDLGFSGFRPGQAETVMRILCGLSTLLVSPPGSGKSLCFQLPALLFHRHSRSIALVVSPLVALMEDQVSDLPRPLRAVRVHSGLAPAQRDAAWEEVCSGSAQLFLVSPEALVAGWAFPKFRARFPPVAFAVLDEAHCVSRWAHNFRP
ncbi:RECQ4 helicase, partial [Campylorhamphus procurvoides]|nr:RECQ4 helicase [Campylorhamphus procurvoides]